jgi:tRNA(adenine34) deaminase
MSVDEAFMQQALALAREAATLGEVPVGAVAVHDGKVIGTGFNRREVDRNPLAHAEMLAMDAAAKALGAWRLTGVTLYVTLEPCAMCAGAIALARIRRLYFGAADPKGGAVLHGPRLFSQATCHHAPEVYPGIGEEEAGALLKQFFRDRRE